MLAAFLSSRRADTVSGAAPLIPRRNKVPPSSCLTTWRARRCTVRSPHPRLRACVRALGTPLEPGERVRGACQCTDECLVRQRRSHHSTTKYLQTPNSRPGVLATRLYARCNHVCVFVCEHWGLPSSVVKGYAARVRSLLSVLLTNTNSKKSVC